MRKNSVKMMLILNPTLKITRSQLGVHSGSLSFFLRSRLVLFIDVFCSGGVFGLYGFWCYYCYSTMMARGGVVTESESGSTMIARFLMDVAGKCVSACFM